MITEKMKRKIIEMIIKSVTNDPKKREELKKIAKKIALIDYKIDDKSRTFVLDLSALVNGSEKAGWRVVVLVDKESRKGLVLEV